MRMRLWLVLGLVCYTVVIVFLDITDPIVSLSVSLWGIPVLLYLGYCVFEYSNSVFSFVKTKFFTKKEL